MNPDIAQGIAVELRDILKEGWTFVEEPERFVVNPPTTSPGDTISPRLLRDEVWRIARFVAYADFVTITKTPGGEFSIVSRNSSGHGFEIVFEVS
jgi:hypothetical protein